MPTTNLATVQFLDSTRSAGSIELESVNHYLTLWFTDHPECHHEVREFKVAVRYIETISGDDLELDTYLKLTLSKDWYKSLYGHDWSVRR